MSLILDALNRSRQNVDPVPGLATQHPVEQIPREGRQYLPWVALAVALALIAWLVFERFSAPPPPAADIGAPVAELSRNIGSAVASVTTELKARAAAPEKGPQTALLEAEPKPEAKLQPAAALTSQPPDVPDVTKAVTPNPTGQSPAQEPAAALESAPAIPRPTVENAAVARLYQNRDESGGTGASASEASALALEDSPATARAEQPIDIEVVLQRAQEEIKNASLDEHAVPFLSSLSQQTKDDIPTLYYQRHDYSSTAAQSSVVLNGTTLKVGGSPLPGMKVEEILPDSVVLSFHGTQFRLRALNSWVNL